MTKQGAAADADEMRLLLERQVEEEVVGLKPDGPAGAYAGGVQRRVDEAEPENSQPGTGWTRPPPPPPPCADVCQECDRYKEVIHKLSKKVEAANAAGESLAPYASASYSLPPHSLRLVIWVSGFSGEGVGDMLQQLGGSWGQAVRNGISGLVRGRRSRTRKEKERGRGRGGNWPVSSRQQERKEKTRGLPPPPPPPSPPNAPPLHPVVQERSRGRVTGRRKI
eukprot:753141-Hanusia_phi.AAC.1